MRAAVFRRFAVPGALLGACLLLSAGNPASGPFAAPATVPHPAGKPPPRPTLPVTRPAARESSRPPIELAREARSYEELGAYGQASDALRRLRGRVAADADLELALAIDEARTGHLDSAAVRLWGPLLSAAIDDSLPVARRHRYPWKREALWLNGRFDGWRWYVARARAEVAGARGEWGRALEAARACVAAHPIAGKEWLIRAVAAGRAGALEEAAESARRAAWLDPALPEARYLHGLYEWRAGRRTGARAEFRAASDLDSSYRAPALALVRAQLPAARPDTLPAVFLTGLREAALLTSPVRPKQEEFVQMDASATLIRQVDAPVPDSLRGTFQDAKMPIGVLIDERGRIVEHDLPWFDPALLPEEMVSATVERLPQWRFRPAMKLGAPHRVWSMVLLTIHSD